MNNDILHHPTPEFRAYLEDEIVGGYRRQRRWQRLRGLAVVFAALAIGASAGLAPAQIRENSQRDSLLQIARTELQLAGMRLELARRHAADVSAKVEAGMLGRQSLVQAEADLNRMMAAAARAKLDVEEITASAMPPRDDLNSPLVGGRDFVTERVMLDLYASQQRLTRAEEVFAEEQRRARAGIIGEAGVLDADLEVTRARAAMGVLAERQKLRRDFLKLGTAAEDLLRRLQRQQVLMDAMVAQKAMDVAQRRLAFIRKQRAAGGATELDELRAEVELKERQAELALLARQLQSGSPSR